MSNATRLEPRQPESGQTELHPLRAAVADMDCLAQGGLRQIAAIARLALLAMESPEAYRNPDRLAAAFDAIWSIAEDIENSVGCRAEEVGLGHGDLAARRRGEAWSQNRREEVRHAA